MTSPRVRGVGRAMVAVGAAAGLLAVAAPPAAAAPPGPPTDYALRASCISTLVPPAVVRNGVSWGQRALEYTAAWQFSRGAGVKVAVIDTGVNPGPAFGSRLSAGADLVERTGSGAGLTDCDGHGTLVAGLIAASPDTRSGFTGVAPDADIVSLRQSSANYGPPGSDTTAAGAGTPKSLADAVDYAAGPLGARVINISLADCQAAGNADNRELTAAVRRAVEVHDAVVVSAAGNLSGSGACSKQNTPGRPPVTAATPADIEVPGVLAVAAVAADGTPAAFSLAGSWVDVAAPGTQIVATNPYPGSRGQVNTIATADGSSAVQGTSFAAPYVAGVVALIRARNPKLSAADVARLVQRTAAHPAAPGGRDDYVGYGLVDPVAALSNTPVTGSVPVAAGSTAPAREANALPVQPLPVTSDHPKRVALWGTLGAVAFLLLLVVGLQSYRVRSRR